MLPMSRVIRLYVSVTLVHPAKVDGWNEMPSGGTLLWSQVTLFLLGPPILPREEEILGWKPDLAMTNRPIEPCDAA